MKGKKVGKNNVNTR